MARYKSKSTGNIHKVISENEYSITLINQDSKYKEKTTWSKWSSISYKNDYIHDYFEFYDHN